MTKFYLTVSTLFTLAMVQGHVHKRQGGALLPNGIASIQPFPPSAFCIGTKLTPSDGSQIKTGACSSTPQGA